ncbi:autotransporter outer membrane beta-barrel domain-containing protein, partial [Bartonella doshiae]
MYNKSVLSYTVTIAIILLNTHFNAYAKFFSAGKGEYKIAPTGERYENIYALNGGKILGKDLKITGLPIQEGSTIKNISGVESNKSGSMIELEGNTTIQNVATGLWAQESGTIKMNGGSIYTKKVGIQAPIGVEAKSNGIIELNKVEIETSHQGQNIMIVDGIGASIKSGGVLRMTDGSIQANYLGVSFEESNNNNNTLENVKINITGPIATSKESVGISAVKNSQVTLKNVTITHAKISVYADDNSQITISEGSIHGDNKGIYAEKDSTIILKDNVEVSSNNYGLSTNGLQSKIIMTGGTITSAGLEPAVLAGSGGQIDLTDVIVQTLDNETTTHNNQIITQTLQVKDEPSTTQGLQAQYLQSKITMTRGSITTAGLTPAVLAAAGGQIDLNDVSINARNTGLQAQGEQSKIVMEKGTLITTNFNPTILAGSGGQINLLDVSIKSNHIGLQAQEKQSKITMKGGTLTKTGPLPAIFAAFGGEIELTDVHIYADDNGLAIRGNQSKITLKDSQIHASTVLIGTSYKGTSGESNIIADHSILKGGANDSEGNLTQTIFSLINGTTWYLRANNKKNNKRHTDRTDNLHSEVSMLHLNDSKIVFNEPTENQYQTLHIGTKTSNTINHNIMNKEVYTANGNATIYFNIEWSDGLAKEQQKADRLLIHGDVSGTTTVYVNNLLEGETLQTENSIPLNTRGLSLIQVSGKADENAFQLANGYLIVDGSPYKYVLRAYGPTSSHGKANVKQSFLGKNKSFWDFRLQSATLDPEEKIRALVPQTASYLVMPNTLFSAGFTDVSNQNALLETMKDKNQGAFLSSYGKK